MFTIADIRNIAVQIEKNGEETYRAASLANSDPGLAKLLACMADDEKRHGEWLSCISSQQALTAEQKEMEAMGRTLLQDMIKGNPFLLSADELENCQKIDQALDRAMGFERDTILFYQFLQGILDEPEAISTMQTIIDEENKHLQHLEYLKKMWENTSHETVPC